MEGYFGVDIIEGQFKDGKAHGWNRQISNNTGYYTSWFSNCNLHGYRQLMNGTTGEILSEHFYKNGQPIADSNFYKNMDEYFNNMQNIKLKNKWLN